MVLGVLKLGMFNPFDNFGKVTISYPKLSVNYKSGPCDNYKTKRTLPIIKIQNQIQPKPWSST